jgi:hypothetical protein
VGIVFVGSDLEVIIYLLCVMAGLLCAYLLVRAYRRRKSRLLVWCALCFILLAINNLVLAADVLFLPDVDLGGLQLLTSLSAVCVLLYAFIWEV